MKKVAIVGVEGSGKTVMLAGLGDLYTYPDEDGYFLAPKNFGTAAYVAEKIERMRKGEWPPATAGDEMQCLDWTLKRSVSEDGKRSEAVCEVSFLDFAGEVYRTAFGIGGGDAALKEQAEKLKRYVQEANDLIVLINLRDVLVHGIRDLRVQEAMWITKSILDVALSEESEHKTPRAAIVLSQADSYAETIKACGGAKGVLKKYLPYVANEYGGLNVFAVNAVDKTVLDDDGNVVPAADFTTQGLLPILKWIRGEDVSIGGCGDAASGGGRGATALPGGPRLLRPNERYPTHGKVQLWKDGPYWAEVNIGAENPWESGYYFWWGDTVGYKFENGVWSASDGSSRGFSFGKINMFSKLLGEKDIQTCGKDFSTLLSKGWIMQNGVLAPEHDAAHVQWGGDWRMPTDGEMYDLCAECDWSRTQKNGIDGFVVRGRGAHASASVFLPCAGYGNGTSLGNVAWHGYFWSSAPDNASSNNAESLYISLDSHNTCGLSRFYGLSVRPVQGEMKMRLVPVVV